MPDPPPTGDHVYRLLLFRFAGIGRAADVMRDADAAAALTGHVLLARAVVERDARGEVHIHEPGRGGVGGTVGAVAGGLLGLLAGPLAVLVLAVAGGAVGGAAGRSAGRAIPPGDLKRLGAALPPDSSALVVLAADTEAEQIADGLKEYQADVVTLTLADELSGELAAAVAAEIARTPAPAAPAGSAAPAASAPPAIP
jgi:uncharacterized membrane protein